MKRSTRPGHRPGDAVTATKTLEAATGHPAASPIDVFGGAELLEDHTNPITTARTSRRLGASLPGAFAAVLLVGTIAFGSNLVPAMPTSSTGGVDDGDTAKAALPLGADPAAATTAWLARLVSDGGHPDGAENPGSESDPVGEDATEPTDHPDADTDDHDGAEADGTDADVDADEPKDEPGADPTPKPEPKPLRIAVALADAGVVVEWSRCEVDAFRYYKIVRSPDERVTWPMGDNDRLVAAIESQRVTRVVDSRAPAASKLFYRVFGFYQRGDRVGIACQSGVAGIKTPPEPTPTDRPAIGLTLAIKDGHVYVDWTACEGVAFDAYKVVRSKDEKVTWPLGDNDILVAAVGPDGKTAYWDGGSPAGKTLWYRVFCVRHVEAGDRVVQSSATKKITTPAAEIAKLGFEVALTDAGVVLHWEACGSDGFRYYKVIRKNDAGTVVLAEIESRPSTAFTDTTAEAGRTYTYQVLAIGYRGDTKVTLGATRPVTVTVH